MLLRFVHWLGVHFTANVAVISICLLTLTSAQAQDDQCWQQRQQALARFRAGANAEAIVLLNRCLNQAGLNDSTKVDIYALLSRAHLAAKDSTSAVRDILSLLDLASEFVPNAVDYTPAYRRFFQAVKRYWTAQQPAKPQPPVEQPDKQDKTPERPRSKKWLWIGGGAALTAGIAYFIIPRPNSENGKVFLPDPPGRPN